MKTRIMLYLVLALFGFAGNSFAVEEPSEIDATEEYDEIIDPQGFEGYNSTLYGKSAGGSITTGIDNSFFGRYAGSGNTTGSDNSFFGRSAGAGNTAGNANSFFGRSAGASNTIGTSNSFFGDNAGYSNSNAEFNSFFGKSAGFSNTLGGDNSFFGVEAGRNNTLGGGNSFFGLQAGHTNQTGDKNVFLGYRAGYWETGSYKLYIDSTGTTSPLIYGEFDNRLLRINGNFRATATSVSSDKRWKKNIEPLESSLDKISNLQGVSYEWKTDEYPDVGMTEGKQIGLVAQDVEKELPELVSEDKDGFKSVSYTKLTAVLVEAVKELKTENQSQKKLIEEQQNQFKKQQAEIEELRSMIKELKG